MPQTASWYSTNGNPDQLMTDARAAAKAAGLDTANFNLDIVAFTSIGFS
jgi:multimeric flavodoxin WrbA